MGVNLTKGGNVSLTKAAPGLTIVTLGLGWDARTTDGSSFDLDASALGLGTDGKIVSNEHFVFYNNKRSPDGSIEHGGDNLTGEGKGDDEVITVNVAAVPPNIDKVTIAVSIYDADTKRLSFGQVRNAYIRVVNQADQTELARYDLSEDASTETAMVFGELYRGNTGSGLTAGGAGAEWKFRAIGQGYASGLSGIAQDFGVTV